MQEREFLGKNQINRTAILQQKMPYSSAEDHDKFAVLS